MMKVWNIFILLGKINLFFLIDIVFKILLLHYMDKTSLL